MLQRYSINLKLQIKQFISFYKYSTVYALSSGYGKCGVAVVRISGDNAKDSILKMTKSRTLPPPRTAVLRHLIDHETGDILDKGLILWFPEPGSFTGEDSVEFHIHGGPAVCKAVLSSLGNLSGFSPAEPGDFTKRAFLNGKLDLTRVEALADLIDAETEAQRKTALGHLEGSLSDIYSDWKEIIIRTRAYLEAYIDFSEDDNIESGVLLEVRKNVESLMEGLNSHLKDARKGERVKSGLDSVILGEPNVGKSSLLNALVRRPAAIVSPVAGTTRDVLRVPLDIGGYPVNVSDTAGLRRTEDLVEKEGVKRALQEVERAHVAFIVVTASDVTRRWSSRRSCEDKSTLGREESRQCHEESRQGYEEFRQNHEELRPVHEESKQSHVESRQGHEESSQIHEESRQCHGESKQSHEKSKQSHEESFWKDYLKEILKISLPNTDIESEWLEEENYLILVNKIDLLSSDDEQKLKEITKDNENVVILSLKTKFGLDEALFKMKMVCERLCGSDKSIDSPILTSERQRTHLNQCLIHLKVIVGQNEDSEGQGDLLMKDETILLAAQMLQLAANELGHVTGQIWTEDVLNDLFSSFCIGK